MYYEYSRKSEMTDWYGVLSPRQALHCYCESCRPVIMIRAFGHVKRSLTGHLVTGWLLRHNLRTHADCVLAWSRKMSRARPTCGAPDLTTFKAATSTDEARAMHADAEVPG